MVEYTEINMRIIRNYDCTSLYPSIMILYGFLSRNLQNKDVYEEAYHKRIQAKREGDLRTSNALKLPLNTAYGILLNKYNDMFDPRMGRSVCITGQLLLTDLVVQYIKMCKTVKIISVNTDGVMLSIDDSELPIIYEINSEWEKRTRIRLEEDKIQKVVMRDVNNYIIRMLNGKIKAKGGVVGNYDGGTFQQNSLQVIAKAIVYNLLDGVSIEETINNEQDPFAFQMITKAGGTYEKVVHVNGFGEVEVNRTNRVYAGKDERLGAVYKIKADGRRDRIANCPEHAIVDNAGILGVDKIDKQWYINLATKRRDEFLGIKPKRKKRSKK
jgi:DNA polymerase elongation subunit (family B)